MFTSLAHAESPETHVAALVIAAVALLVGWVAGRASARREHAAREQRERASASPPRD